MQKAFPVNTEADLDSFLAELNAALTQAVPDENARKIISDQLVPIIRQTRVNLTLPLPPTTYHLIDEDDRLAWEETSKLAEHVIVFEMNKSWAKR